MKVCWDLALTCASGPDGVAHVCGSVKPKETSRVDVPFDHGTFTGAGTCDKRTKIDVQDSC